MTHWNVHELRQAVINGPNVHPGLVEEEESYQQINSIWAINIHGELRE